MNILSIESSCDDTSVAILQDGRKICSNLISSQIEVHRLFGGVVPEIASRRHLESVNRLLAEAFREAAMTVKDIDLVAVTRGPGLVGALLVGISAAKAISYVRGIPIVGVNHMEGHVSANFIASPDLEPPFHTLVVSGGHTYLCTVADYASFQVVGSTVDDAAGECLDKVARVLGLGYPGGPAIQKIAEQGNPDAFSFPRAMMRVEDGLQMSFSGLKTAVMQAVRKIQQSGEAIPVADLAASVQKAVVDALIKKSVRLMEENPLPAFCLSGGVAANALLRDEMAQACKERGIQFHVPPAVLCTDNAAMIGAAGYFRYKKDGADDLNFVADPDLSL